MVDDWVSTPFPSVSDTELVENCAANVDDPPPPYPSREQSSRSAVALSGRRRHAQRMQVVPELGHIITGSETYANTDSHVLAPEYADTETSTLTPPHSTALGHVHTPRRRRQSVSHTSVASAAPSLTQTILSLFKTTDNEDVCEDTRHDAHTDEESSPIQSDRNERTRLLDSSRDVTRSGYDYDWAMIDDSTPGHRRQRAQQLEASRKYGFFSCAAWKRYFGPMTHPAYYKSLFHLLILNFPYALVAWIYLFVFTLTGTTLLVALPLGAVLCFLDLLGARAFARGELALQSRFHSPLAYPPPYPPRPIFTRTRPPTVIELEMGLTAAPETSFYKNTYAMFTDPTTYQALFYFIVIKPSITILLSLFLIIFVLPSMVLILPAPAMLRAVRRLGAWQANVAIEGLYMAVR